MSALELSVINPRMILYPEKLGSVQKKAHEKWPHLVALLEEVQIFDGLTNTEKLLLSEFTGLRFCSRPIWTMGDHKKKARLNKHESNKYN